MCLAIKADYVISSIRICSTCSNGSSGEVVRGNATVNTITGRDNVPNYFFTAAEEFL